MNEAFKTRVDDVLGTVKLPAGIDITFKSVFGAVGVYADGGIFMTCGKFGLGLKLDDQTCELLLQSGDGEPLKYFDKGHVKRNYVVLADDVTGDAGRLQALVNKSLAFVHAARTTKSG
jgi:TfoX/Sxy family transcriptional regulator of competence genes